MTRLLTLPRLDSSRWADEYDECLDGYWLTKRQRDMGNKHQLMWSIMRFRYEGTKSYYLFPDGTVVTEGDTWTDCALAAATAMGYTLAENYDGVQDIVPPDRFVELLHLAGTIARDKGDYLVWVAPEDDPFAGNDFLDLM